MNNVGDAQFRVMCDMWGVDAAIKALNRMGMAPTDEQIEAEQQKKNAAQERWNSIFKPKEE